MQSFLACLSISSRFDLPVCESDLHDSPPDWSCCAIQLLPIQRVSRREANASAWALVDAIRVVGGWPNYVRRRRAISASVIEKAITGNLLPEDITKVEIAAFLEPPGGF